MKSIEWHLENIKKLTEQYKQKAMELNKTEIEELQNIGIYQPVFAGDVIGKSTCKGLKEKGLVMQYEGDYVLTEAGKAKFKELFPDKKTGSKVTISYK